MNNRNLTVCLLVYNHSHLIREVIESILEQSYKNFYLIISDDCSGDNSFFIAKSFEKIDQRIKVIKTPQNLGMARNANFVLSMVNTEFVAILHHDDILDKRCFEKWMNIAQKDQNVSFVFNAYLDDHYNKKRVIKIRNSLPEIINGPIFLKKYLLKYWGCPVRGTALFRKKFWDEIGGMNEKYELLADVDLWMRFSSKWKVGFVNEPLIKVIHQRPNDYPKDYTEFSWKRKFLLFDIHSSNINRNNYPNYLQYIFKRFIFRNKVSFEIIKWHGYALIRKKSFIIKSYSFNNNKYEFFYSSIFRFIINKISLILNKK